MFLSAKTFQKDKNTKYFAYDTVYHSYLYFFVINEMALLFEDVVGMET
jgi:hypothetical protein